MTVKVLQKTATMEAGGIQKFLIGMHQNIDTEKIQFDYYLNTDKHQFYTEEINKLGGKIFAGTKTKLKVLKYILRLMDYYRLLKKYNYKIVHINEALVTSAVSAIVSRIAGVPVIIVHSHNDHFAEKFDYFSKVLNKWARWINSKCGTHFFACSSSAAKWLFTKQLCNANKVITVNNGIMANKYTFNLNVRNNERKKLGINEKFVIGHVGRFFSQKNHAFIIDVFTEILRREPNAVLLLIGEGELLEVIKDRAKQNKISDNVIFYGPSNSIPELMQAMDVFIFPSLYEGLGIVAIESQAASLMTICSDTVPSEVDITHYCKHLKLSAGTIAWAEEILKYRCGYERENAYKYVDDAGFNVTAVAKWLENYYLEREAELL